MLGHIQFFFYVFSVVVVVVVATRHPAHFTTTDVRPLHWTLGPLSPEPQSLHVESHNPAHNPKTAFQIFEAFMLKH